MNIIKAISERNEILQTGWEEVRKATIIECVEAQYPKEVTKSHFVSDIIIEGDKALVKWHKRFQMLDEDE